MTIKKFFDADAIEVVSAPPTETATEVVATEAQQVVNPLSALAAAGRLNMGGEIIDEVPTYTPQTEEGVATETNPPADTANETVEEVKVHTFDEPSIETEVTTTQVEEPVVTKETVRWQDVIKNEATDTVLKELGFDEKVAGFLNHWKSGGDIQEYLREMSTDYAKMPAEDVMKHQLRLEYPKASEKQIELLYEEEVVSRYKIDPEVYDETEVEKGKMLLEAKAEKYRDGLIANQQKFLLPPAPKNEPQVIQPNNEAAEQQQRIIDDTKRSVLESPQFKQVLSTNRMVIGEGDEAFAFSANANELSDIIYDSEKFLNSMFTVKTESDGSIKLIADPEKQMLVAAVAKYGKQLFVEYAKHYKAVGGKKAIEPIENPSGVQASQVVKSESANFSPAAMLAKGGRMNA